MWTEAQWDIPLLPFPLSLERAMLFPDRQAPGLGSKKDRMKRESESFPPENPTHSNVAVFSLPYLGRVFPGARRGEEWPPAPQIIRALGRFRGEENRLRKSCVFPLPYIFAHKGA